MNKETEKHCTKNICNVFFKKMNVMKNKDRVSNWCWSKILKKQSQIQCIILSIVDQGKNFCEEITGATGSFENHTISLDNKLYKCHIPWILLL